MIEKIVISVAATIVVAILTCIASALKKQGKKIELLMIAQQQGLRHDLMDMYYTARRWNCITDDDAELFEAMYNAYHNLGQNGVMTSRYEEILDLRKVPYYGYIEKEEKEKQNHVQ